MSDVARKSRRSEAVRRGFAARKIAELTGATTRNPFGRARRFYRQEFRAWEYGWYLGGLPDAPDQG